MRLRSVVRPLLIAGVISSTLGTGSVAGVEASPPGLLPDLEMAAPRDFSIERRPRGVRWLRFDTIVLNTGAGPLDVYGYQHADDPIGSYGVVQRIRQSDGTWTEYETPATMFYDGDGHGHWHVRDLQEWTIARADNPSQALRWGAKSGFCFWDNVDYSTTNGPVYYYPTTTSACEERSDGRVPMGLSVYWGDEYPSNIAGQYINITNLGYGDYIVTVKADQRLELFESDESNNSNWARIRIAKNGVTVLSQGAAP